MNTEQTPPSETQGQPPAVPQDVSFIPEWTPPARTQEDTPPAWASMLMERMEAIESRAFEPNYSFEDPSEKFQNQLQGLQSVVGQLAQSVMAPKVAEGLVAELGKDLNDHGQAYLRNYFSEHPLTAETAQQLRSNPSTMQLIRNAAELAHFKSQGSATTARSRTMEPVDNPRASDAGLPPEYEAEAERMFRAFSAEDSRYTKEMARQAIKDAMRSQGRYHREMMRMSEFAD